MSYSIGPISFPFLEAHSWDTRRQTQIVNVPFARQTGFSIGSELVSYSLSGQFYADTEAEAKVLRRQLNELFDNSDIDFEYIQFDGEDDEELSGWFLLDQISTSIPPSSLGPYPFSASVRRLGNLSTHLFGTYWTSNPYANDYTLTGREWVAAPNSLGSTFNNDRPGEGGENQIIVTPTPLDSPIIYRSQPTFPDFYDMACRVYFTPYNATSGIDTVLDALNGSLPKTEIFSNDHLPDYSVLLEDDRIIISNGLVAFDYAAGEFGAAYVYDTSAWVRVLTGITFTGLPIIIGPAGGTFLDSYQRRPIFEKISKDEIVFRILMAVANDYDQGHVLVKYKLKRGSYFLDTYLATNYNLITSTSSYLASDGALSSLSSAANYTVASNSSGKVGFLHTETATSTISSSVRLLLGYIVAANSETRFGVLVTPPTLPSGTTLADLGDEFIANMRQQPVLVDPRWL